MYKEIRETVRDDKGFTLVELAVVMVIIGLLIGGILKGQEMIENAKVNSTISQIKAIDAASNTFQDMYGAIPGDMLTASARIPGVANNGGGDNLLGTTAPFAVPAAAGTENLYFFQHLGGADLLVGADATMAAYLTASIADVAFAPGQQPANTAMGLAAAGDARGGRYIAAQNVVPANIGLTPLQAGRIDRKLDDGLPGRGSVISDGTAAACGVAATGYTESYKGVGCKTAVRIN